MATRMQVRRGNNVPPVETTTSNVNSGLINYEMGYNTATKYLYINDNGTIRPMDAYDSELLDGINSTQFVRNDDGNQVIDGDLTLSGELKSTAQSARYADIAEYYETDRTYEAGDILMVGSDTEASLADGSMPIMGVCSTNPAFLMNDDIEATHFAPIALKGRVPVKITGEASRGDYIILDVDTNKGIAVKSLEGIDDKLYVGICITEGEDTCEVKV